MTEVTDLREAARLSSCAFCETRHPRTDYGCPDRLEVDVYDVVFVPAGFRAPRELDGDEFTGTRYQFLPPVKRDSVAIYTEHGVFAGILGVATLQARRGSPWSPNQSHSWVIDWHTMDRIAEAALTLSAGRRGSEALSDGPSWGHNEDLRHAVRAAEVAIHAGLMDAGEAYDRVFESLDDDYAHEVRERVTELLVAAEQGRDA